MRIVLGLLFLSFSGFLVAQDLLEGQLRDEWEVFWKEQDEHYKNKESSPLKKKERRHFVGHEIFEFNPEFYVKARFLRNPNPDTLVMKTSANTEKVYVKYAFAEFEINQVACRLTIFQNLKLAKNPGFEDYLFLPFTDLNSGALSYGGGKYLDLRIPDGEEIILNFNLAYNPYCAYTTGWYCPIPPEENDLPVAINAGAKNPLDH